MVRYDPNLDAYAVLGVSAAATRQEIDKAFRRAARMWHPDKSPAPDAAARFNECKQAASLLRDPAARREYDRQRELFLGPAARVRRERQQRRRETGAAHSVPMRPPPAWMGRSVRVHFDAVVIQMERPRSPSASNGVLSSAALIALGAAVARGELIWFALALVLWGAARVVAQPPHDGVLAWARVVPGRREAEYNTLDARMARFRRQEVPWSQLVVSVATDGGAYRILIRGFPEEAIPVLLRTYDLGEARRCAREAGEWLDLPFERAA